MHEKKMYSRLAFFLCTVRNMFYKNILNLILTVHSRKPSSGNTLMHVLEVLKNCA